MEVGQSNCSSLVGLVSEKGRLPPIEHFAALRGSEITIYTTKEKGLKNIMIVKNTTVKKKM